ncbi:MAG: hypothetical protein PVF27_07720 [Gemmatimonadales bacterium]
MARVQTRAGGYAADPVWDGLRLTQIRAGLSAEGDFHIVAPQEGDEYEIPPGVDARFASLAFRTAGANGTRVRWFVDGRALAGARWQLVRGAHTVRAVTEAGQSDAVRIVVR